MDFIMEIISNYYWVQKELIVLALIYSHKYLYFTITVFTKINY
jgi:hypothetical protein